jgi:DNA segregation ATPase FtsK/SpoIIIE, S-DNA-T family
MAKETLVSTVNSEISKSRQHSEDFAGPSKRHEVLGVCTALGALFLLLSLLSYQPAAEGVPFGESNWMGVAGQWTTYFLFALLGVTAYLLDAFLWVFAISLFFPRPKNLRALNTLGMLVIAMLSAVLLHTALDKQPINGHAPGGFIGELLGEFLASLVSTGGTYLIAIGGILLTLLLVTDISLVRTVRGAGLLLAAAGKVIGTYGRRIVAAWINADFVEAPEMVDGIEPGPLPVAVPEKPSVEFPQERETEAKPEREKKITEPVIVKNKPAKKPRSKPQESLSINSEPVPGNFKLPPLDLISGAPEDSGQSDVDEQHLKQLADKLVQVLADFNVYGEVREIHPGPVVTMFEFQPKSGTKLSKIEGLSSELAMVLEVIRVRVVAPIPGKHAVGFELPNKKRETVFLKDMLLDESFNNPKFKLPLALGRDIAGNPFAVDLAKMPHLLVAGTTGSGKSVSINSMLLSLLYKYTPEDLRLLLVDPKMIELGTYDHIPHLLLPVVTDMSKACLALKWAVDEMERRYQLFADLGVRNLAAYNKKVESLKKAHSAKSDEEKRRERAGDYHSVENEEVVVVSSAGPNPEKLEKLPFIVTVVDELADLMMVAAKDVETSIARLAQKARAAGIHLIIATQRPSVDVITGLIKANFPSRVSFRVSSGTDSRTILGTIGAENLLGMGDMLILPPGTSDLSRVHGAFVEDDEILKVVEFLKTQGTPNYDDEILRPRDDDMGDDIGEDEKDEVYDQAVAIVAEAQTCSISMLQRKLRIGYNRSARIVEIMEKEGVVGPANGVNKREVLISPQ